jgi:hypothetical protein
MAFTVTMMSWSIIEYGEHRADGGGGGAGARRGSEAVKWGTDYFVKAHPEPNVLYGEVGWLRHATRRRVSCVPSSHP